MGCFETWAKVAFKWEGGWSDHPSDRGGKTNRGITWETFKANAARIGLPATEAAHRALTSEQAYKIARLFWDEVRGDDLGCGVAIILADWYWGSGGYGIQRAQRVLGVPQDGGVGPRTVNAANERKEAELVDALYKAREQHFRDIVAANPSQAVFLKGWQNRNLEIYQTAKANLGKKKVRP